MADHAGVPAGWMVGPMWISIAFAVSSSWRLRMPRPVFAAAQSVVGVVISGMFRPSDLPLLLHHWYAALMVSLGTLTVSLLIGVWFSRAAGIDRATAVLGALPGGASGMVAMGADLGADAKLVAVMQYVRLILVVLSASLTTRLLAPVSHAHVLWPAAASRIPWYDALLSLTAGAIGSYAGIRLRIPAGALLGSIVGSTVAHALGLPVTTSSFMAAAAYIVIGMYVGLLFDRASLRHAGMLLPRMAASTLALIAVCGWLGWALDRLTGDGLLTCLLATSPGGLDSVSLTALSGGANIALVVSLQTVRLFSIILLGPWLARRVIRAS